MGLALERVPTMSNPAVRLALERVPTMSNPAMGMCPQISAHLSSVEILQVKLTIPVTV